MEKHDPDHHGLHRATNIDTLELLSQTSSIFNMLSEMLELGGGQMLPADAYTQLVSALSQLVAANIDPNDARARRIPEALAQITARGSKWPFAVRGKAKLLQRSWEIKYGRNFAGGRDSPGRRHLEVGSEPNRGSLRKLHQLLDLPTPSKAVRNTPDSHSPSSQISIGLKRPRLVRSRSLMLVQNAKPREAPDPLTCGHLVFKVGDWWTRPLAAKADGIIDSATGITADDEGAYALIIVGDQEVATDQIWRSRYRADSADPMSRKLLRNLRTQDPVRLLRSATQTIDVKKGDFRLIPRAGVRYDGLYKVTGYSVRKEKGEFGLWRFEFSLERLGNQPVLDLAMVAPTDEQIRASSLSDDDIEDEPDRDRGDDMLVKVIESRRGSGTSLVLDVFNRGPVVPLSPMSLHSPFS